MTAASVLPAQSYQAVADIAVVSGPTFLVESLVLRWMVCFRLREGKWPGLGDSNVWDRDRTGQWRRIREERWKDIGQALLTGTRGLARLKGYSLSRLRQEHGLSVTLTADQILQWMRAFESKEGRWPTHTDEAVWQLNRSQEWIRMPATWQGISACLMCGVGGAPPMSLIHFRRAYAQGAEAQTAPPEVEELAPELGQAPSSLKSLQPMETAGPIEILAVSESTDLLEVRRTTDASPLGRHAPLSSSQDDSARAGLSGVPAATLPRPALRARTNTSIKPLLSAQQIEQWLKTFRAKEGRWPQLSDKHVWAGETPAWMLVSDETWSGIDTALHRGSRGLEAFKGQTLLQFRRSLGLNDHLTEDQLRIWILAYQEKMGRWPARDARDVWMRDTAGEWHLVPNETWGALDDALRYGRRGLEAWRGSTLAGFRKRLGLDRALTEDRIVEWMRLFHDKEGRYPTARDRTVWILDATTGGWRALPSETWAAISSALHQGGRGLKALKGCTLWQLRAAHGMIEVADALTESLIVQWIQFFRDKEGHYPGLADIAVWNRLTDGGYEPIPHLTWQRINDALVNRTRGLPEGPGITLDVFKQTHQLVDLPPITEAQLQRWIHLHRVKTGAWPTPKSPTVWDSDPTTDEWVIVAEYTWRRICSALHYGTCGLGSLRGTTLSKYRHQQGLVDEEITLDQIVLWMQLFFEKEGRWPTRHDTNVWERNEHDQWVVMTGRHWSTLATSLRRGDFEEVGRTSLRDLRRARIQGADDRLTPATLERWLQIFHRKEGRYPVTEDRTVWDQDEAGGFYQVHGESWQALSSAIPLGLRGLAALKGSTLLQFRIDHGCVDDRALTEEQLIRWIQLFHEKEAKWPRINDQHVWERAADGSWMIVANESWEALNATLRKGTRNLTAFRGQSLSKFRHSHGLCTEDLTEERILRWVRLYQEKTQSWPVQTSPTVWDRSPEDQRWIALDSESWAKLHQALAGGHRGLPGGSSLSQLRHKHGLCDIGLHPDRIARWIQFFYDKEGRWPHNADPTIWERSAQDGWQAVPRETWRKIDTALTLGLRGLAMLKGSSLTKFRFARGLITAGEAAPRRWGPGLVHSKRTRAKGPSSKEKPCGDRLGMRLPQ